MMLTILTSADGSHLTKRLTSTPQGWRKTAIANVARFNVMSTDVADFAELSVILTELEKHPTSCVVRGRLKDGSPTVDVARRIHDQPSEPAAFEEKPCHWVMLDIDALPAPRPDMTIAQRLAYIVSTLPAPFHTADFHYRWSSSAGIDGWATLSCHLYFWLSQPARCSDLRRRAGDEDGGEDWQVDLALLNPVQIHYTANPIFEGAPDPLGGPRSGYVTRHSRSVVLPSWTATAPVWAPTGAPRPMRKTFEQRLADIGPNYHLPILRAAACYVAIHGHDADLYALKEALRDAIHAGAPGKNSKRGYLANSYLDRVINGAVRKFAHQS